MKKILILSDSDRTWQETIQGPSLFSQGETFKVDGYVDFLVLETQDGTSKYNQIAFVSPPVHALNE